MPALIAAITNIFILLSRLMYFIYDIWNIFKWNFLYFINLIKTFPGFLGSIGRWIFEYISILPARGAEAMLIQTAKWLNLAFASSCCGFIQDAAELPDVIQSIPGLGYFTEPFQIQYGFSVILCALSIKLCIKWIPQIAVTRLPRLPSPNWPQLPGS